MVTNTKAETLRHFILKCLIYKRLKELGRKANCEYEHEGLGVLDAVDWSSGLAFEVIESSLSTNQLESKQERYLKISGVNDIIFVKTSRFKLQDSIEAWYSIIKELVV